MLGVGTDLVESDMHCAVRENFCELAEERIQRGPNLIRRRVQVRRRRARPRDTCSKLHAAHWS